MTTDLALPVLDCLCAGIVVADHVCAPIAEIPKPGTLIETPQLQLTIGGCASNCAVDMTRLGLAAAVAGTIGEDVLGRFIREELTDAGVDCTFLESRPDLATSGTLVINVTGEDRRFIHTTAANAHFTTETITDAILERSRVLYLGGYCLAAEPTATRVTDLFTRARDRGVTTILDVVVPGPGDYVDRLATVLPVTDYFLPNDDEAGLLSGIADPGKQAEAFRQAGATTVVVTCGARGAVLVGPQDRWRAGAHDVPFVDGTGSGDAFVAAFVLALLDGAPPTRCLEFGSAAGALCVQSTGATTAMPDANTLRRFVDTSVLPIETL
ncbi:MAG: sugar kinase [Planctomycetaceae bacterium]